jgi:neutral ceramidase
MSVIAGVGRADITPPVGIRLSGYASRKTGSTGIHDDLTATVLYLEQDGAPAALVGLDVIMLGADEVAEIRRCCQELTEIPAERIFVACTHTHAGPQTGPGEGDPLQAAYAECLRWKIAGALREAKLRAEPVQLGYTRKAVRLAGNRRERTPEGTILGYNPDAPTPAETDILQVLTAEGRTLAALIVYDCHGTTMGPDNYLISADYQGYARRLVERELPGCLAMVLGGCGANQNPYPRGTFEWAERHGRRLGAAAYQGLLEIEETEVVERLGLYTNEAKLPVAALPSAAECQAELQAAEAAAEAERDPDGALSWTTERRLRHAKERLEAAERGDTDLGIPVELQVIALDDVAFVSLPGEIFFEIGQAIRQASPFAVTLPLGWSNGSIGYIPTQAEVPFGGYEIEMARASKHGLPARDDADAVLVAEAVKALAAAKGGA